MLHVLLFIFMGFMVLTVTLGNWVFQMSMDRAAAAQSGAARLAEGVVQVGIARLIKVPGTAPSDMPGLNLTLPSYPEGVGLLCLDPANATSNNVPLTYLSYNNLGGTSSIPGRNGVPVQPETASLVGVGRYAGREVHLEVILNCPPFPYVVGSSVPIQSTGLEVFGIQNPGALSAGFSSIPNNQKVPGHIITNALNPSTTISALQLGSDTLISGDAQSHGDIALLGNATVKGSLRPTADQGPLPSIDVTTLDPISKPLYNAISTASMDGSTAPMSGFNRRVGDLSVTNGLNLQGGVLYVQGNLNVNGGIQGSGAILATGTVQVDGGGSLTGNAQAAIISQGSVTLRGTAPDARAEYRGLVYTGGNLNCENANIAGAVVVNNQDPTGSTVMTSVSVAESPPLTSFSIPITTTSTVASSAPRDPNLRSPAGIRGYSAQNGVSFNSQNDPWPVANGGDGLPHPVTPEFIWYPANGDGSDMTVPPGYIVTQTTPYKQIAIDPAVTDFVSVGHVRQINFNPTDPIVGVTSFNGNPTVYLQGTGTELTTEASVLSAMGSSLSAWGGTGLPSDYISNLNPKVQAFMLDVVSCYNANAAYIASQPPGTVSLGTPGSSWTTTETVDWKLDLGQFFNTADRIRVLSWKQI